MNHSVDQLQRILIPFLGGASTVVLLLLAMLVVGKGMAKLGSSRRARLEKQCQPLVDALLLPNPSIRTAEQLACYVPKHGEVVGQLLVAPASRVAGPAIDRLRHTARAFGTIEEWIRTLSDRRWWRRADAARSLGQLKVASAVDLLVAALDDHDEEVRAAAVDALGNIGEPRTVPALVSRLPRQSRHQRVRIVEALRRFGRAAVPSLMAYEQLHPEDRAIVAELFGTIAATEAIDDLLRWTTDERPAVRIATMHALGSIGLDQRGYYYALRALSSDPDAEMRAMAARALGRGARCEAAPYLARHLKDDWIVAGHAAMGLREMGRAGADALRVQATDGGTHGDLARQILAETDDEAAMPDAVAV